MKRLIPVSLALFSTVALAEAPKALPKVGDALGLADWPKLTWLYDAPAASDAAGKVVVHWFCTPRIAECRDDLARVIALRDLGRAYIVAYIDSGKYEAKKLDPIRESEGVGRGTVAYGRVVGQLMKQLGIAPGPTSIVVGVDGKVALVSIGGDATTLDARDHKVAALIGAIKDYSAAYDGPKTVKPNEKFQLVAKVQLADWLTYSAKSPASFALTAPADIKCDNRKLAGDQLRIDGHTVTATVTCWAPKGNYEAQGRISFGYLDTSHNEGVVEDGTTWKFAVTPAAP